MAERFAASVGAGHVYTSAKRNEGIDELFVSLTSTIIKRNAKQEAAVPRSDLLYNRPIPNFPSLTCFAGKT